LAELQSLPALRQINLNDLAQCAALLSACGQCEVFFPGEATHSPTSARRMNQAIGELTRFSDEYQALASPLLGSGIRADYIDRLVYRAAVNDGDPQQVTEHVWKAFVAAGRRCIADGNVLESEADNRTELARLVGVVMKDKWPLWKNLGML
jgi:hypothetical protein